VKILLAIFLGTVAAAAQVGRTPDVRDPVQEPALAQAQLLPMLTSFHRITGDLIIGDHPWKSGCTGLGNSVVWDPESKQFAMLYSGFDGKRCINNLNEQAHMQVGLAWSPDGFHWTDDAANPVLPVNPIPGSEDAGGLTYPQIIRYKNLWYVFHTCTTAPGYENGQVNICLSTSASLRGPWRRAGVQVAAKEISWAGRTEHSQVYRPNVFPLGGRWYMVFNAGEDIGKEDVGYATAASPDGPWTISPDMMVCRAKSPSCTPSKAMQVGVALSDPQIVRFGHQFIMMGWSSNPDSTWFATTSEQDFPQGWKQLAVVTDRPLQRGTFLDVDGRMLIYAQTRYSNIGLYELSPQP
jgi:hypothetical protein